jgi:uncharacterized OB-fold protein
MTTQSDFNLSELKVPGPTRNALTEQFWTAAAQGKLLIQQCGSCSKAVFYPRAICPHCWQDALSWREASGHGRLKSFSEIWKPGHPGWLPVSPYLVGLVELEEGPTMLSHILAENNAVKIRDALVFAPTDVGGRVLPLFKKS